MKKWIYSFLLITISFLTSNEMGAQDMITNQEKESTSNIMEEKDKLVVVWTSGDKEVAMNMVFMYTYNAMKQGWWKDVTLLVWGPSQKLLAADKELQDYVGKMKEVGVEVLACKACADICSVSGELEDLGVHVKYTGMDLTNFIKERHVITF